MDAPSLTKQHSPEDVLFSHLVQIRTALWRNSSAGRASVMIGAGFSRQAESLALHAGKFPLWSDLRRNLADTLRLRDDDTTEVLDVAQLYEDRFGRSALDDAIIAAMPDSAYGPGDAHRKLLALPWADVFTTNYDTLLERAGTDIFERRYERIVVAADLPMRASPRIVKLHGTLPSQRPFIVTRNDYLEYPRKQAPFVNLVRQAAMETALVLLGFSGKDPNFIEWTGWVQDQLGPQAPPIYLCGVLDLTAEQLPLLAKRRIIPIDLGFFFSSRDFPQRDARHAAATDWLLKVLAQGKPARPVEWAPISAPDETTLQPAGPSVPRFTAFQEIWPKHDQPLTPERLAEVLQVWARQRAEYPGWLVAPDTVRRRIWHGTEHWRQRVFQECSQLPPVTQLRLLRELVWRLDLCLVSMWTSEAQQIAALLERCNLFPGILDLPQAEPLPNDAIGPEMADAWVELALAVVRLAREDMDEKVHALWMKRLELLTPVWPQLGAQLWAELSYWALARLDLNQLDKAMRLWLANDHTLSGRARLAALKAELGENDAARELASTVLQALRSRLGALQSPLELLSLEAWLITLLELVREDLGIRNQEVRDRLAELRRWNCSPDDIRDGLQSDLKELQPPLKAERTEEPEFDPGRSNISRRTSWGLNMDDMIPAFTVLRLVEVAPCAFHSRNRSYLSHEAARAAVWLQTTAPFWAAGMIVRTHYKEALSHFLDRATAALLPMERVDGLWTMLHRLSTQVLPRIPDNFRAAHDDVVCQMGAIGLELLSRIAFRLRPEQLDSLLELLLAWLRSERAAGAWSFDDPVRSLLNRVVFALPVVKLPAAAARLLAVPVWAESRFGSDDNCRWPDPVDAMYERDDWPAEHPDIPTTLVETLAQHVRSGDKGVVRRAAARLLFMKERGWLSAEHLATFSAGVWARTDAASGLPMHLRTFTARGMLELPDAGQHGIEINMRARLTFSNFAALRQTDGKSIRTDALSDLRRHLDEVRQTCGVFFRRPAILSLTKDEGRRILNGIIEWWPLNTSTLAEIHQTKKWQFAFEPGAARALAGSFASLTGECLLPLLKDEPEAVSTISTWLQQMEKDGFDGTLATLGLLAAKATGTVEATERISLLLLSDTRKGINDGSWLVSSWLRAHRAGTISEPCPQSLINLLAERVALRAEPALELSCDWLAQVIEEFGEVMSADSRSLLLRSLDVLAGVTDLEQWNRNHARGMAERNEAYRLMGLRTSAAGLANALFKSAVKNQRPPEPILERWRLLASESPLPEIHRAWSAPA
ncbi:MAG: SIR2 family protein [Lacunisphaera sp.]|nr:SIR2 family protein [Lacunisphaera sp.]